MEESLVEACIFRYLPKECRPPEWSGMWSEIAEGYLSIGVTVIGLFGNIMAFAVLRQPGFHDVFNKLLIALSSFDILFLGKQNLCLIMMTSIFYIIVILYSPTRIFFL